MKKNWLVWYEEGVELEIEAETSLKAAQGYVNEAHLSEDDTEFFIDILALDMDLIDNNNGKFLPRNVKKHRMRIEPTN